MDGENANSVKSSDGSAELDVVAFPVEDLGATEDREVFKFGLSNSWAVVGNDHKLAGAGSELLEGELVT